jgi:hypothetical protein
MKKIILCLIVTCLLLTILPYQLNAANKTTSSSIVVSKPANSEAEAKALMLRLNEIKDMDKSNLTPTDKRELRREVISIRERLRSITGGVFVSAGAIIIILLLLIILL